MTVTPYDLFAFGNANGPRLPRINKDFFPNAIGLVAPEDPKNLHGASLVSDINQSPMKGFYYKLPAGTALPDELDVVADGSDTDPKSLHGPTHHTLFVVKTITLDRLFDLYKDLPWIREGKK